MTMESFKAEIGRRVAKADPTIAREWDRLAEKHGAQALVGKVPEDGDFVGFVEGKKPVAA